LVAPAPEGEDGEKKDAKKEEAKKEEGKEAEKPAEGEKGVFAIFAKPTQVQTEEGEERTIMNAVLLNDASEEPREVLHIAPFSEEERQKALVVYQDLVATTSEVQIADAESSVKAALEKLEFAAVPEGEPHEGMFKFRAEEGEEGGLAEAAARMVDELLPSLGPMGGEAWVKTVASLAWPELLQKQDAEGTGALPIEGLAQAWLAVPERLLQFVQGRLDKIEAHVPP